MMKKQNIFVESHPYELQGGPNSHETEVRQLDLEQRSTLLRRAWNGWLKVAHILGTIQMIIILTLICWTLFALTAIPFKLIADPL